MKPEQALQIQIVNTLRVCAPDVLVFHVPNGGKRNVREAKRFKEMGVVAGIPDLICLWAFKNIGFIEVKAGRGTTTDRQAEIHDRLDDMHFHVAVAWSVSDALALLSRWGAPINGRIAA